MNRGVDASEVELILDGHPPSDYHVDGEHAYPINPDNGERVIIDAVTDGGVSCVLQTKEYLDSRYQGAKHETALSKASDPVRIRDLTRSNKDNLGNVSSDDRIGGLNFSKAVVKKTKGVIKQGKKTTGKKYNQKTKSTSKKERAVTVVSKSGDGSKKTPLKMKLNIDLDKLCRGPFSKDYPKKYQTRVNFDAYRSGAKYRLGQTKKLINKSPLSVPKPGKQESTHSTKVINEHLVNECGIDKRDLFGISPAQKKEIAGNSTGLNANAYVVDEPHGRSLGGKPSIGNLYVAPPSQNSSFNKVDGQIKKGINPRLLGKKDSVYAKIEFTYKDS
ncbi:hypothetical protein OAJ27_02125 [bacterium]|nr:hypothetical protein [bacterium]